MERYPEWRLNWISKIKAESLRVLLQARNSLAEKRGPLTEEAEFHHASTDDYYWNESYYFNFSDPQKKIGGFSRIGMLPNQKTVRGILFLFLGDGSIVMYDESEPINAKQGGLQVGFLRYEIIQPLLEWRIHFQGKMVHLQDARMLLETPEKRKPADPNLHTVSVDLTFRGWSPCHDFKDMDLGAFAERIVAKGTRLQDLRAISKVASEHNEQAGTWMGKIEIEGKELSFEGSGHRDHSWGIRDWKAPKKWTWLTAQFRDQIAFNLSRVVIRSLDVFNGFICRSGKNYPLRRAHLETEFEPDGLTQKRVLFRLQDVSGWDMEVVGKPITVVPLVLEEKGHRTLVNEAFTEYHWNEHTGYGISEYLHQLVE